MNQYFSIINHRTVITLIISIVIPYVCYHFKIIYNIDLTLISIAIIFPLVFAIRGAFRRREKALEHLSRMKSGLYSVLYLFETNQKLSEQKRGEVISIVKNVNESLIFHLKEKEKNIDVLHSSFDKLIGFVKANEDCMSSSLKTKMFSYMLKVHEGIENTLAIHVHRTPISLKAYCKVFIYLFPLIYTPTIINKIGLENPAWLTYFVVILSEFILISLYNIQDDMEYPFDDQGLDDIKLEKFLFKK